MRKFRPIKVSKISESIAAQLELLILEGGLEPGEKLPSERELADEMEVSRPSLREAIVVLEARGLLETQRGGGTYVQSLVSPMMVDPLINLMREHPDAKFDVLEMRSILEVAATGCAAERRTSADLALIQKRFSKLEDIYTAREFDHESEVEADVAFHLVLGEASHNMALAHIMRSMIELLRADISFNIESVRRREEDHAALREQHQAIYEAVVAGEADAARAEAKRHLDFVDKKLRENIKHQEREVRAERRLERTDR
jgi:GntR family transcriptional repressor for pyruvate dehydrogenase complex